MAEARAKGEGETRNKRTHSPPPFPNLNPNPRKHNNLKELVSSLYNCHSCDRYVPPRRQTLASLYPLVCEWRVVHLCDQCLCLIKSAVKCSCCFADFPSSDLPRRRFSSPNLFCVLIAALCRGLVIRSLGAFLLGFRWMNWRRWPKGKEKALEKVRDAKRATEGAREALGAVSVRTIDPADPAVDDE